MRTLVLGIGNLLLGDEGVGVHAAQALMREGVPDGTEVLEVGTSILDALPALEKAERIILLDAVKAEGEPGTVYRTSLSECSGSRCIASMHGFDIFRVLSLAGRSDLPEVLVLGVEPAYISWSLELSPQVSAALPVLLNTVRAEIMKADASAERMRA